MTTTIVSGIFLFLPIVLGIVGVAIFSAKKNVESKNNWVSLSLETCKIISPTKFPNLFHKCFKKWKHKSEIGGNKLVKQVETYLWIGWKHWCEISIFTIVN